MKLSLSTSTKGGSIFSEIRMEDNSWLKKVHILAVDGHSGRGRPRKTWEHVIIEDLHVKGLRLRREVAQNRAEWRSATT